MHSFEKIICLRAIAWKSARTVSKLSWLAEQKSGANLVSVLECWSKCTCLPFLLMCFCKLATCATRMRLCMKVVDRMELRWRDRIYECDEEWRGRLQQSTKAQAAEAGPASPPEIFRAASKFPSLFHQSHQFRCEVAIIMVSRIIFLFKHCKDDLN